MREQQTAVRTATCFERCTAHDGQHATTTIVPKSNPSFSLEHLGDARPSTGSEVGDGAGTAEESQPAGLVKDETDYFRLADHPSRTGLPLPASQFRTPLVRLTATMRLSQQVPSGPLSCTYCAAVQELRRPTAESDRFHCGSTRRPPADSCARLRSSCRRANSESR